MLIENNVLAHETFLMIHSLAMGGEKLTINCFKSHACVKLNSNYLFYFLGNQCGDGREIV